jgi:hypothetical protein
VSLWLLELEDDLLELSLWPLEADLLEWLWPMLATVSVIQEGNATYLWLPGITTVSVGMFICVKYWSWSLLSSEQGDYKTF